MPVIAEGKNRFASPMCMHVRHTHPQRSLLRPKHILHTSGAPSLTDCPSTDVSEDIEDIVMLWLPFPPSACAVIAGPGSAVVASTSMLRASHIVANRTLMRMVAPSPACA